MRNITKILSHRNLESAELSEIVEKIFDFKLIRDGQELEGDFINNIIVKEWEPTRLTVKFEFGMPLNVSTGSEPDRIVASIRNESFPFFSSETSHV